MKKYFLSLLVGLTISVNLHAQGESKWSYEIGFSFFKSSLNNQPDEILFNPVFTKWENINQQPDKYSVDEYKPLDPYPFNLCVGVDYFIKYKKYFMIKFGYTYTNTLGIGGKGNISYTDKSNSLSYVESKEMRYSSHQITYFIGPVIPIGENGPEIFMGLSMMPPTWVKYQEKYKKSEGANVLVDYDKTFKGFFGNCRTMIGMQVPISEHCNLGTELIFAYFNGIELKSGSLKDEGFKFPSMEWNFTVRYKIH